MLSSCPRLHAANFVGRQVQQKRPGREILSLSTIKERFQEALTAAGAGSSVSQLDLKQGCDLLYLWGRALENEGKQGSTPPGDRSMDRTPEFLYSKLLETLSSLSQAQQVGANAGDAAPVASFHSGTAPAETSELDAINAALGIEAVPAGSELEVGESGAGPLAPTTLSSLSLEQTTNMFWAVYVVKRKTNRTFLSDLEVSLINSITARYADAEVLLGLSGLKSKNQGQNASEMGFSDSILESKREELVDHLREFLHPSDAVRTVWTTSQLFTNGGGAFTRNGYVGAKPTGRDRDKGAGMMTRDAVEKTAVAASKLRVVCDAVTTAVAEHHHYRSKFEPGKLSVILHSAVKLNLPSAPKLIQVLCEKHEIGRLITDATVLDCSSTLHALGHYADLLSKGDACGACFGSSQENKPLPLELVLDISQVHSALLRAWRKHATLEGKTSWEALRGREFSQILFNLAKTEGALPTGGGSPERAAFLSTMLNQQFSSYQPRDLAAMDVTQMSWALSKLGLGAQPHHLSMFFQVIQKHAAELAQQARNPNRRGPPLKPLCGDVSSVLHSHVGLYEAEVATKLKENPSITGAQREQLESDCKTKYRDSLLRFSQWFSQEYGPFDVQDGVKGFKKSQSIALYAWSLAKFEVQDKEFMRFVLHTSTAGKGSSGSSSVPILHYPLASFTWQGLSMLGWSVATQGSFNQQDWWYALGCEVTRRCQEVSQPGFRSAKNSSTFEHQSTGGGFVEAKSSDRPAQQNLANLLWAFGSFAAHHDKSPIDIPMLYTVFRAVRPHIRPKDMGALDIVHTVWCMAKCLIKDRGLIEELLTRWNLVAGAGCGFQNPGVSTMMRVNLLYSLSFLNVQTRIFEHIPLTGLSEFVGDCSPLSISNLCWACALQPGNWAFFDAFLKTCNAQGVFFGGKKMDFSPSERKQIYSSLLWMRDQCPDKAGETAVLIDRILLEGGLFGEGFSASGSESEANVSSMSPEQRNEAINSLLEKVRESGEALDSTRGSQMSREIQKVLEEVFGKAEDGMNLKNKGGETGAGVAADSPPKPFQLVEEFIPPGMPWSPCDLAIPSKKIAVEINGPVHYLIEHDGAVPSGATNPREFISDPQDYFGFLTRTRRHVPAELDAATGAGESGKKLSFSLDGASTFKYEFLRKLGYKALPLPYYEWDRLNTPEERRKYVIGKLRNCVTA